MERISGEVKKGGILDLQYCSIRQKLIRGLFPLLYYFEPRAFLVMLTAQTVLINIRLQLYDPHRGCKMIIHRTTFHINALKRHVPPAFGLFIYYNNGKCIKLDMHYEFIK